MKSWRVFASEKLGGGGVEKGPAENGGSEGGGGQGTQPIFNTLYARKPDENFRGWRGWESGWPAIE